MFNTTRDVLVTEEGRWRKRVLTGAKCLKQTLHVPCHPVDRNLRVCAVNVRFKKDSRSVFLKETRSTVRVPVFKNELVVFVVPAKKESRSFPRFLGFRFRKLIENETTKIKNPIPG